MTRVWRTRHGGRYHRDSLCPGISDGHAKAAAEGYAIHAATEFHLRDLDPSVTPCARCWGQAMQADGWLASRLTAELIADSAYEIDFYDAVLRRVSGLDPDYVRVQHKATGASGTRYRVDYALVRPGEQPIAIEIDGFQKEKDRNEADDARQSSMSARQNDLVNAGWKFLRFTNQQVTTAAGTCRAEIETALRWRSQPHLSPTPASPTSLSTTTSSSVARAAENRALATERQSLGRRWLLGAAGLLLVGGGAVWMVAQTGDAGDDGSVSPSGYECPETHEIKGNIADDGERIYHRPGDRFYDATIPEECFDSGAAAEDAGYRESKV